MTPAKLNLFLASFPYGGNGATSSEVPTVRHWFARTIVAAKKDERIDGVLWQDFSDTPITMTRNAAVVAARRAGADVLLMIDSDMAPDLYVGKDPEARTFFEIAFDFVYRRRMEGKPVVVGAPYCGPPPVECVYVFRWTSMESGGADLHPKMEMYSREDAAKMGGIQPAAALPTGLILFDMEIFDHTDPKHEYQRLLQMHDRKTAEALTRSWFYYEYDDIYQAQKASTEDVTATRDMGLVVEDKLGYNPLHCAWDSWAGHWKPKCVGKPQPIYGDSVNEKYRTAVTENRISNERLVMVRNGKVQM